MPNTNVDEVLAMVNAGMGGIPGFEANKIGLADTPTVSDWHVTGLLEDISLAYRPRKFIAEEVMPVVRVSKHQDSIREYTKDDWNRVQADVRPETGRGPRGGFGLTTQTYECISYSMSTDVTDKERDVATGPDDPDVSATEWCTDQVMLLMEWIVATLIFTAGNYPTGNKETLSGTDQWSDGGSDPVGKITDAKAAVKAKLGYDPNTLILGPSVKRKILNHPVVVDRFPGAQRVVPNLVDLAAIFDVEKVVVGDATRTTSQEGAAADTYTEIWGSHAALIYTPPSPGLLTPTFGYTLIWDEEDHIVESWRNGDGATSDAIRARTAFDEKILASFAGYLFTDAVA